MSFFGSNQGDIAPSYTALQLNTATSILPIPIAWGTVKVGINIIWYANLKLYKTESGGGGGGKGGGGLFGGGQVTYYYGADMIIALCEGPISGVGAIWTNNAQYTLATVGTPGAGWTLFDGTIPQDIWTYLSDNYPMQAISYQGTAYFGIPNAYLGSNATFGQTNVEVKGIFAGSGVNGVDADPAMCVDDFLTNAIYGVGFASASIDYSTLYGSGRDASLQTYCQAQGIGISPLLTTAEQGSTILTRWLQLLNCAAVWSGGKLKFIPYGDLAIDSGNITTTVQITVPTPVPAPTPPTPFPEVQLVSAASFVSDGGVKYAFSGTALTHTGTSPTGVGTYGINPAGTYIFFSAGSGNDVGQVLNITFTYSNTSNYVPNLAVVYSLTDHDYIGDNNKDPVTCSRVDPYSLPTIQRIECFSRNNQYAGVPVEARDQSQIEIYGPRVGTTIQAHEICDEVIIGPIVAQTILQRQLYVRATFTWKLSWEYCLLDPMDIVEITDANLGLSGYPVRIRSIEEDDKGLLTFIAEELTVGISTPAYYPSSGGSVSIQPNTAAGVYSVNTPLIYEPPPGATGGVAVVWIGASGGNAGVVDPNWGGAYIWLSIDNVTYEQLTTSLSAPIAQGVLTANIASASGWDTTNTLAVNLAESGGELAGTSMAYAQQGGTLSLVDSELLAYEVATLTSSYHYNLTDLQRGLYGTSGAAHLSGANYFRIVLGSTVIAYDLPPSYIGVTLYVKFQSFNIFGSGVEELSACTAYTYVPTGAGLSPAFQEVVSGLSGASVSAPIQIPANVYLASVASLVTTTITGPMSFEVGTSASPGLFGSSLPLTAGSSYAGAISSMLITTPTTIVLTATGGSFTAGAVQLTITYAQSVAPNGGTG
jgi:hypothetical protein